MKHVYRLLTFVTWILAATSCSKEAGQVTSPESMVLGCDSLRLGNDAQTEITLELTTDQAWVLDSVLPATGSEAVDWLTVYDQEGSGNATIKLSCKQNENPADRLALVRFKIQGAYAEYRTCTVIQSGTPMVTTGPVSEVTTENITLSGTYVYTGSAITRTGFEVWKNDNDETKEVVYAEGTAIDFSLTYPITYGNEYRYRAFVEGFAGKIFPADNEERISIRFSLGTPKVEGELRTNVDATGTYVVVPYYFGDGKSYTVSGSCNIEGLAIGTKSVVFDPNGGEVRLPVTGTPATTGTATFMLTGLPHASEPVTVSTEVLEGGKGLVLYLETFGPKPSETIAFSLTKTYTGADAQNFTSEIIDYLDFSRTEQPNAEYVRYTADTHVRHEPIMYPKPEHYAWASGSPVLSVGTNKTGILTINNLNLKGATNIKLEFGYISYIATFIKEVVVEYSNNGGETWNQVNWQLTKPYTPGTNNEYNLAETTEEIVGSENFSLRITINAGTKTSRIDDLRLTGDRL